MSAPFMRSLAKLEQIEGGYSDNPDDSGGKTNYGITEAVARAFGYKGEMRDMSYSTAAAIYKERYWDLMRLDDIAAISWPIADELFDSGVNCGQNVAARWLQRTLNACNRQGKDYPDLAVDGLIGRMSISALQSLFALRKANAELIVLRALNSLQGEFYISLAQLRGKDENFVPGWFLNRVVI